MYRHAVAVFTAASAMLLTPTGPAHAADGPALWCGNNHVFSTNETPARPAPSPALTVTADDIRALMNTIAASTSLQGFFSPALSMPAVPGISYNGAAITWPSYVPAQAAAPNPAPSGSSPADVSPESAMIEDIIGRALVACSHSTTAPVTVPSTATLDDASIAKLAGALLATNPATCVMAPAAPAPAPAPAQSPTTLLDAIGVRQLLDAIGVRRRETPAADPAAAAADNPAACTFPDSLMDAIGVTDLFN
ncbi:hypothetical protein [Nonomuraea insulae]|uniref:Uncharacterized protein n=1 Tax=Nonomuraea insulae TaxID=1616787 RepID=A0ABW1CYD8_9ACTN